MVNKQYHYFKIRVDCKTYNQASYIMDTMNGFCMQETNFPFICVIIDDASTDGEPVVIRNYLCEHFELNEGDTFLRIEETDDYVLTMTRHKTNRNCYFAVFFLKYNHYSIKKSKQLYIDEWKNTKYVALCEGDDYWTSPIKLQKQVDFLDTHSEYSLTSHRYSVLNQELNIFEDIVSQTNFKNKDGVVFDNSSIDWLAKTLTLVYRNNKLDDYWNYPGIKWDVILVYFLLKHGKGFCFSDNMGTYRLNSSSTYGEKSKMERKEFVFLQYNELYGFEKNSVTRHRYYSTLIQYIFFTHGQAFKKVKLSLKDFFFIPLYIIEDLWLRLYDKFR